MKTTVVLVRHGQSQGNLKDLFLGHTDLPLTPLGLSQAALASVYLDRYKFDAIVSSDLTRAMQTAAPTAARQGLTIDIDHLRECGL